MKRVGMPELGLLQVGVPDWIWFQNVVIPVLGMGLGALAMFGVYRTINRALDRRHERLLATDRGGASPELEEMRTRLEALEDAAYRVTDLEERLDFAERLLTRAQDPSSSPQGD
jgi:hypothetical protein